MLAATHDYNPLRRYQPRVPVQELCTEHDDYSTADAILIDVSEEGLQIQRPIGGTRSRFLQLEFEIPGVDELIWARGEIRFDEVWPVPKGTPGSLAGMVRTSGIHVIRAADRHRRLLREYVNDTWSAIQTLHEITDDEPMSAFLMNASCYLRG
jgi:hypothetical protein